MSVNITVNGKFAKHCRTHPLLNDPQQVRKQDEQERRKLRLLQVREESKKLAKKIREEVNEEKKRELQNLQATKEQELECWRQHALQRKEEDYRSAIFQIGTAHRAAQRENQQQAEKQKTQGTYKDFKKQMAARRCNKGKVQFNADNNCKCKQTRVCPIKQYKCIYTQTENSDKYDEPHKRKRDNFSSGESECEDEGYKEQTLPQSSLSTISSSFDSSLSSLDNNRATQTSMCKTPAVFLDVEVGTDDSITITAPTEVNDKHAQYNQQFSSVIRVSPSKGRKTKTNKSENPQGKQSTTTITSTTQSYEISEKEQEKSFGNQSQKTNFQQTKEKRFTLISDLVKKQQDQPPTTDSLASSIPTPTASINPTKFIPSRPPLSRATPGTESIQLSPSKEAKSTTSRPLMTGTTSLSQRKASASSKSSKTVTEKSHPVSTATASLNTGVPSVSSGLGRVQFYDYSSKLSKERAQSQTTANVQRQQDFTQPTAMEQAALENLRERERQQELNHKSKQAEERGKKALEREQVRRDCNELTEKLEALTREYPKQAANSESQPHLFVDRQLRKEGKMNSAVEKLLSRPNIITCSESNKYNSNNRNTKTSDNLGAVFNELNVGASSNNALPADDVSSDSCCSILLGYVDDQSRLVRQDLKQWPNDDNDTNQKQKRLKILLKRLELLRNSLMQELKFESETKKEEAGVENSKFSSNEENLRQVIDSISEIRREREQILVNEISKESKPLREREKELQTKEALLEEKVKEFFELQKKQNKAKKEAKQVKEKITKESTSSTDMDVRDVVDTEDNKENKICSSKKNPLEIIITVRGETQCIKIPQKPKRNISRKSPNKLASLIRSPQTKASAMAKRQTPKKKVATAKPVLNQDVLKRQNSYDSNSTSYMSLPTVLPTKIDDLAERITNERKNYPMPSSSTQVQTGASERFSKDQHQTIGQESESSLGPLDDTTGYKQPARINPLIAQYVQRLLGMSRNAVQKLGVSSSDIETPGSTIINTSNNVTSSETIISDDRLIDIHNFVEENKSFIKDLEQSIKSQNHETLENSLRVFEDIWRQRLRSHSLTKKRSKEKTITKNQQGKQYTTRPQTSKELKNREEGTTKDQKLLINKSYKEDSITEKNSSKDKEKEARVKELMEIISNSSKKSDKEDVIQEKASTSGSFKNQKKSALNKNKKELEKSLSSQYSTDDKETPNPMKKRTRKVENVDKTIETRLSQESNKTDSQIARYAKLTENCTHRIAELTELINRVREEKQRLLEVTLSSVSDNGRQSTEYLELPDGKSSTRNDQEDFTRISSSSEETTQNKQALSMDSLNDIRKLSSSDKHKQITASRDSGIAESRPITAQENRLDQEPVSQSSSETAIPQPQRKMKPPPTIKRFSPQLPDDDLAHELSTILEVDTPATSRINTAVGQLAEERINATDSEPHEPKKFPTFEQYVNQLELDLTQLDPELSMQLQQEFNNYLEFLKQQQSPANLHKYNEFPSVNAYIENLLEGGGHSLTIEESIAQLRISNIHPQNFPAVRDYLKRNVSKTSAAEQLIDTESLENVTEEPASTDSESIDIEKELKRRNILKNSFRYVETNQKIFSSTANRGNVAFYKEMIAAESGVDKLSTSENSVALLESDLKRKVHQWPGGIRKKSQQYHALSSTTTSTNTSDLANSALKAASMDDSTKDNGRPLNLRDFLTRELLKRANISTSNSSSNSDESLRSYFLHSIIGSLTPITNRAASKSGGQTLDRQKTSTPVPIHSTQTHSTTSSNSNTSSGQLFSGESRLSSVHYYDRSVRFCTSDGDKADQSSE